MDKLSYTMESYLDAIYELSSGDDGARLTDVALRMGVTKSTASAAVTSLVKKELVANGHYQRLHLTEAGETLAKSVTQKHAVIRRFFTASLGIDDETSDTDACAVEHILSDKTIRAMREYLAKK